MTQKCLLHDPEVGIGHGKECCCICSSQLIATVCNCFDVWPVSLMQGKPHELNNNHFDIGYVCLVFQRDGVAELKKDRHGGCECFTKKEEVSGE